MDSALVEEKRTTSATGGEKGTKRARFDLIPPHVLWFLAELYGAGAEKYDDRNYLKGYDWSKSYAALERHLNLFWSGEEDWDPETRVPHLVNAVWHCMSLCEFMLNPDVYGLYDDRPHVGIERYLLMRDEILGKNKQESDYDSDS